MSEPRGEAFYMENGQPADRAIHDEILAGVDPAAELEHKQWSLQWLVSRGVDAEVAARALGLPGAYDIGPGPESLR